MADVTVLPTFSTADNSEPSNALIAGIRFHGRHDVSTAMTTCSRSTLSREPGNTNGSTDMTITPSITITDATPPKSNVSLDPAATVTLSSSVASTSNATPNSKGRDSSYRLLYRGALSLPDSYMLLDGLTFSARLPSHIASTSYDSPSHMLAVSQADSFARELMNNPLALALESMRGRPSLRFKGTVRLQDVWLDEEGDVCMDIHPFSTLSRIYFENILCLSPLIPPSQRPSYPKRTEVGIRVALGDTDGPETTEIIIYGEARTHVHPPESTLSGASTSLAALPPLTIRVARLTPAPRAPRPDDPTPRQPPAHLLSASHIGELGANKRIRPESIKGKWKEQEEGDIVRRAREVMLHLPGSKTPANGRRKEKIPEKDNAIDNQKHKKERAKVGETVFKVPELPVKARRKQGGGRADVFGAVEPLQSLPAGKGKAKATENDVDAEDAEGVGSVEAANKLVLKKAAVRHLAAVGILRTHPEFKDLFGFVYRGAAFALRAQITSFPLSAHAVDALVQAHVRLYVSTPDVDEINRVVSGAGLRG
ncbi:hypothetical protein F5I97DRAFT_225706 [Phlebopus sp. FC_14]|nr:hypothetical protein F5I97DRAFT_225706 [Phlebopus sp. FC_14]